MQYGRIWSAWTALGALAIAGYFLLPSGGLAANLAYNGIGLTSALMILVAVRLHRPSRPAMWYWFAAGQVAWVFGDVVFEIYKYVLHQQPYPSLADVFYLSAYPMVLIGFLLLVRDRGRGRDLAGLIDASIVATGLGLVFWLFVLRPTVAGDATMITRLISAAYPALDAMLLAVLARLFTGAGGRTAGARLLALAALLLLAADVGFSVTSLYWPADSGSGFLDADGRAVGVLSTQFLDGSRSNGVTDLALALAYADAHGGLGAVTLVPGTARFRSVG